MLSVRTLILFMILVALSSCNKKEAGTGASVDINTGGIFNPISLSYNNVEIQPVHDLGEFLLGSPKKVFLFSVRNNSLYRIFNIDVTLEGDNPLGFKFNKNGSAPAVFPGFSGTCSDSLPPGGSCLVALQFETSIKGIYEQDITFHYVNLVEPTSRPLKLTILAGNAASLVFESGETSFAFGNKVGLSQIPVVEKELDQEYQQVVKVSNVGDLKARDIQLSLEQNCLSESSKDCPLGLENAYRFSSDCPKILANGDYCQATVYFYPKNKDIDRSTPNPSFKQVKFDAVLKYDYLNSLDGANNKAALSASFTSVSTKIEANFETSIDSLPFDTELTVGNRAEKSVRINNRGFREGQLRFLIIERGGSDVGFCVRAADSFMDCYTDSTFTTPLTLAEFPFYFKDQDNCFATIELTDSPNVSVDSGCQLGMFFQPSITYTARGAKQFKLKAEFDSHWLDGVNLVRNSFLTSSGTYLSAARMVPQKIVYNGLTLPSTSLAELNRVMSFNLGRAGILSPNSFKRRKLEITFLNEGDSVASNISVKDGWNINIPKTEDTLSGVDLFPPGDAIKPHYVAAKIATEQCNQIPAGQTCTVSMLFAPILKGSDVYDTRPYTFDHYDSVNVELSYKSFFLNYIDGSLYSDLNRTDVVDVGSATAQAQMKADLVAKGVFDDVEMATLEVPDGPHPFSKQTKSYVILTNIGTDVVKYTGYTGKTLFTETTGLSVVDSDLPKISTLHAAELYAPLKDCRSIIDFNYSTTQTCPEVNAKLSTLGRLDPDESCALTIQRDFTTKQLTSNTGNSGVGNELGRLNVSAFKNDQASWEFLNYKINLNPEFDYFDNDVVNPNPIGSLGSCVGSLQKTAPGFREIEFLKAGRIAPHTVRPFTSALLYRPGFILPSLPSKNSFNIPDRWFVGPDNVPDPANSANTSSEVVTAFNSVNYFPSNLILPLDLSQTDYIIHLGTFPVSKRIVSSFRLTSSAKSLTSTWKGSSSSLILKPSDSTLTNQFSYSLNIPLETKWAGTDISFPTSYGYPVGLSFTADKAGIFANEFTYYYNNGDFNSDGSPVLIQQKILVVAEAVDDAPDLEVKVASYKVTKRDNQVPLLVPSTPNGFVESDYTVYNAGAGDSASTDDPITLDAVKTSNPTNFDFYVRKQIRLKNTSTTQTLSLFKLFGKDSAGATKTSSLNLGTDSPMKICLDNSLSACSGTCGGLTTLAPQASCYFEAYYRPDQTSTPREVTITANFEIKTYQHFARNITVSFFPKEPATVIAYAKALEPVRVSFGNLQSYPLDFSTTTEMTTDPMVFAFDKASGLTRILIKNNSTTRASFLKSYHDFIGTESTTIVPSDSDYNYVVAGVNYIQIYQANYSNGQPRIQAYASKACLVGGISAEEVALSDYQKGFNINTTTPCYMAVVLRANSHYQNLELLTNQPIIMEPNHLRLPYYDNDRSYSGKMLSFHFKGKLKPNGSVGDPDSALAYSSVKASSTGTVTFKWRSMTPKTIEMGSIVGYRVYYTTSSSALNDVYSAKTTYVDFAPSPDSNGFFQMTHNNLAAKTFYYYRVVPIRQYTDYNPTATFPGLTPLPFYNLAPPKYLSASLVPTLSVVVPPTDMYYDHGAQMLISRSIKNPVTNPGVLTFKQAQSACASPATPALRLSRSGAAVDFRQRLITQAAWNSIVSNQAESSYNIYAFSLWLDGTTQNIHTTLSAPSIIGYNPNEDAKYLTSNLIYYQKVSKCQPTCYGEKAVGTVYHTPNYAGYESYISTGYNFGTARCYVNLLSP